jgi:hypothetical protein
VTREFDDEATVVDFAKARARELADKRQARWRSMDRVRHVATIQRLLGLPHESRFDVTSKRQGVVARDGYSIETLILERAGQVPLPTLLCLPKEPANRKLPAVIYVDGRGKAASLLPGGRIEKLVTSGQVVLSVDLRGYGKTILK